jgi:hypothetical protein
MEFNLPFAVTAGNPPIHWAEGAERLLDPR